MPLPEPLGNDLLGDSMRVSPCQLLRVLRPGGWGLKHEHWIPEQIQIHIQIHIQTQTQGVGVSSTSTECLRGTSVCAGMYDKMNTCNDWRAGCKGRFQTSAHLCCRSQSRGSTPVLIMSVNLGSETLWWWCWWWWSKKTNGCKSPDKETLLLPYSLSELQTVETGRTWDLRSELKSTFYWFV